MSRLNKHKTAHCGQRNSATYRLAKTPLSQAGFTIVELVTVIAIIGLLVTSFYVMFNNNLSQYLALQKDGSDFTDLAYQSQRLGNVLRGITDITSVSASDITCYTYFSSNDTYVSQVHYYKNTAGTALLADITPMTANPPIGTPITAKKRTVKIINNFYQSPTLSTFVYLDNSGTPMTLPISDEHTINGIQVNLATVGAHNSNASVSLQVSLRNRKINL